MEFFPHGTRELGSTINRNFRGDAKTGDPNPEQGAAARLGFDIRKRFRFCPPREAVDDGEEIPHPTSLGEGTNQVQMKRGEAGTQKRAMRQG